MYVVAVMQPCIYSLHCLLHLLRSLEHNLVIHCQVAVDELNVHDKLYCECGEVRVAVHLLDTCIYFLHYICIFVFAVFLCPSLESSFFGELCLNNLVVDNGLVHTDRVLPVVAYFSLLVGITDSDILALCHLLTDNLESNVAHSDAWLILLVHSLLYLIACKVT